jgi:hypothetical protein
MVPAKQYFSFSLRCGASILFQVEYMSLFVLFLLFPLLGTRVLASSVFEGRFLAHPAVLCLYFTLKLSLFSHKMNCSYSLRYRFGIYEV